MEEIISRIALSIPGFLLGVVCHEAAHAYMALKFGDDTGERLGRLSFNPVVHADPVGTVVLPLVFTLLGGVTFGYAKPVPVQPSRFRNIKWGVFWVSFAGPLANILLCILSAFFFALITLYVPGSFGLKLPFIEMLRYSIYINVVLAVFNLIPLPPLDGGQMLQTFLSYENARKFAELQRYTFLFFIILMITGALGYVIAPALGMAQFVLNFFMALLSGVLF